MENSLTPVMAGYFPVVYSKTMTKEEMRIAHNYLFRSKGNDYQPQELEQFNAFLEFSKHKPPNPKKVALLMVSVNQNYWQYTGQVFEDIEKYFLPGHETKLFLWSDMPQKELSFLKEKEEEIIKLQEEFSKEKNHEKRVQFIFTFFGKFLEALYLWTSADMQQVELAAKQFGLIAQFQPLQDGVMNLVLTNTNEATANIIANATLELIKKQRNLQEKSTMFEVEPIEWPYGTLLRYSMFLQQEELLKEYDYIFYLDVDMRIVNVVGDEILGSSLTVAPHPGYYLRKELYPPYEPNDQSASFIKRPGKVVIMDGQPRFMPFYAAGGFQGGTKNSFLKAMKETKKLIDTDLNKNNYIPIWNDETAWNKYVFDCQTKEEINETIFLTPSYIYPDSLIKEYYEKFWGKSYPPKIITLTKPFTVQKVDMGKFQNM